MAAGLSRGDGGRNEEILLRSVRRDGGSELVASMAVVCLCVCMCVRGSYVMCLIT